MTGGKGFAQRNMCKTRSFTQISAKTADKCAYRPFSHILLTEGKADGGGPGVFPRSAPEGQPRKRRGYKRKMQAVKACIFRVWMTGLEPATSWSLTRCATNCATSRGPLVQKGLQISAFFSENARICWRFRQTGAPLNLMGAVLSVISDRQRLKSDRGEPQASIYHMEGRFLCGCLAKTLNQPTECVHRPNLGTPGHENPV